MAHLPFFKLGVLLVKQATKPMTRAVKARALTSETLGSICEYVGQRWHVYTTNVNLRVQGHKVTRVKPLNEQEATQSGAELLTEGFVLTIGISALIIESRRSARAAAQKAAAKEERRHQKFLAMQHLSDTVRDLARYTVDLEKALIEAEKSRREAEANKKPMPALVLPIPPHSVAEMIGETASPMDMVVAAHHKEKEAENKEHWSKSLIQKLTFDSAAGAIKWVGSVVNADADDDDDDLDMDNDDE